MERNIARVRAMTDEEIVSRIGRKMREFVAKTPHASYPKDLADVQAFNLLYREACRKNIFTKK